MIAVNILIFRQWSNSMENNRQNDATVTSDEKRAKKVQWQLIISTMIYAVLCPSLVRVPFFSAMVAGSPRVTPLMVGVVMSLTSLLPLSVPISIYLMWSRYRRGQYSKALFLSGLPIYTLFALFLILGLLDPLIR